MTRALLFVVAIGACDGAEVGADATPCEPAALAPTWKGSAGAVLTIVATDPAPPARFTNWWTVTVAGGELRAVSAFMPAHGHGSPTTPAIAPGADGLLVGPLELWMPGAWEVRFELVGDDITVPVCVRP